MPTTETITGTDITDFTTKVAPNNTISSSEVMSNLNILRGHIIPLDPTASAAGLAGNWDLGGATYNWRNVYGYRLLPLLSYQR